MRHFDPFGLVPLAWEIALSALGGVSGIWAWMRARRAQSWPSAQGTICSAISRHGGSRYFKPWVSEFIYNYVVNGEYYSGSHRIRSRTMRRADEVTEGWKGRMVVVRHSPEDHTISVLLNSDQPGGQVGNQ